MFAIIFSFEILIAISAGNNNPNRLPADADIKFPFPAFDAGNRILLREFPSSTIRIGTTDRTNTLMRIHAITFVDALNLVCVCHGYSSFELKYSQVP